MTTRWTLAVALVCIVALASVPGGDALWGKKKTLEAKTTPSPDPVQEPVPAVVVGDAEPRAAEEPAHQTEQQDPEPAAQADLPTHYWHNAVTGESLWNYPNYEAKDENDITYYIDPVTKASSYEKPASLDWRSYEDDQHQTYYANAQTGESTYSIPAMLAWRRFATEQHSEL